MTGTVEFARSTSPTPASRARPCRPARWRSALDDDVRARGEAAAELLQVESDREVRTLGRDDEHSNVRGRSRPPPRRAAGRATARCPWRCAPLLDRATAWRRARRLRGSTPRMKNSMLLLVRIDLSLRRPRRRTRCAQYTALVPISMKIFADSASAFIADRPDAAPRQLAWDGLRGGRTADHRATRSGATPR